MKSLFSVILMLTFSISAFANSGGPPNGYAGNPPNSNNCTVCHSGNPVNSGDGELTVSLETDQYTPGETYEVTVSLTDPGQLRYGFELTVQDGSNNMAGTLTVTNATITQLSDQGGNSPDYMKQTSGGTFQNQDAALWTFNWTAPEAGTGDITFYLAGNAANANFTTTGDFIYTQSLTISEGGGGANPPEMFSLLMPDDEAMIDEMEVGLSWEATTDPDAGDEISYQVYVSTDENTVMDNMVGTTETTTYDFMGDDDSEYFWTVKAVDTNTDGTWANEIWSFSIAVPESPMVFDLDSPENGFTSPSTMVSLAWNESSDPDPGDVITYEIYVSDDESSVMDNMVGTTDGLSFDFEGSHGMTYWWTIKAVDTNTDGTWATSTFSFSVDVNAVDNNSNASITDWSLSAAYPNPFNAVTRFNLSVPDQGNVSLAIYNVLGQEVSKIHQGNLQPGVHSFTWHAEVPAGVYFLSVQTASGFSSLQKLVLLK